MAPARRAVSVRLQSSTIAGVGEAKARAAATVEAKGRVPRLIRGVAQPSAKKLQFLVTPAIIIAGNVRVEAKQDSGNLGDLKEHLLGDR